MTRLILLFALLSAPLVAQSSSVDRRARLEHLLQLMNMELVKEQMIDQVFRSLLSSMPSNVPREIRPKVEEAKRKVLELIKRRFSWQVMKPQYMKLYEEAFTDEEIDGMIAFYSTPAGQSCLKKIPIVMQRSMVIGRDAMMELNPEIQRIFKEAAAR
jgi:hypothetical protein